MKTIKASKIQNLVADLCVLANFDLRPDVRKALELAYRKEPKARARKILAAIIENAALAKSKKLAICQDTGMPVVFIGLGQGVYVSGDLPSAVHEGVKIGYLNGSLRNSIILDPIRRGSPGYQPAVLHTELVKGNKVLITVLPKGFGCENKSQLRMFKPTASWEQLKEFIVKAVKDAGPDACPPYVVGVGIGGTADYASLLAKKALLRKISDHRLPQSRIEKELLSALNKLNIGPMGLGGETTVLAVHLETYPTHIAGLPVAVNISCHALRSATAAL